MRRCRRDLISNRGLVSVSLRIRVDKGDTLKRNSERIGVVEIDSFTVLEQRKGLQNRYLRGNQTLNEMTGNVKIKSHIEK